MPPPPPSPVCRRVDQLEASLAAEREAPATLPVTDGSRASSQNSLNELVPHNNNNTAVATLTAHTSDEEVTTCT